MSSISSIFPFVNSTTADASDVNDVFYHIAQGTRLPMGGNDLDYTTGVYDLGSSTYRWNDLYCEDINISGSLTTSDKNIYSLIAETTLTSATSRIEFTGLNGDSCGEYIILCRSISDTATSAGISYLHFNGDSATNYGYQRIAAISTTVSAARNTSYSGIQVVGTALGKIDYSIIKVYTNSGYERTVLQDILQRGSSTTIGVFGSWSWIWNNTSDTITSMQFENSNGDAIFSTGTTIQIWGRK